MPGAAGPGSQQGAQQQASLPPLPPGTAGQPLTAPAPAGQPGAQQASQHASAPIAVTAWHGSPAADGNWYYQPPAASQNGGQQPAVPAGYQVNGFSPVGYAQPGQTTAPLATRPPVTGPAGNGTGQQASLAGTPSPQGPPFGGLNGMQQYAPAVQTAPGGYPQALSPPSAGGHQPPFGQPNQAGPGPLGQPGQMALPALAAPPPPAGQPSAPAPAGPAGSPAEALWAARDRRAVSAALPGRATVPDAAVADRGGTAVPSTAGTAGTVIGAGLPGGAHDGDRRDRRPGAVTARAGGDRSAHGLAWRAPGPACSRPGGAAASRRAAAADRAGSVRVGRHAADAVATGPLAGLSPPPPTAPPAPPSSLASAAQGAHAAPTASATIGKLTGSRGRRAARRPRLAMSAIFADLVDMADIPRSAYAVDEEVTGSMCLFKTDGGYEVFSCAEDARHEVRFFEEEEAAYFYLFGVLAAEALRNGRLTPHRA